VQGRIQRALGEIERPGAPLLEPLKDRVAVCGLFGDRGQDQRVELSVERIGLHT
jgi:hypothetical protein